MDESGNTKGVSITVPLTSCLTGLDYSVLQIKTKIVSCHLADPKTVKQEVNGTVILPPVVFPGWVIVTPTLSNFLLCQMHFWSKVVVHIIPLKRFHQTHFCQFFLAGFVIQGFINKDPTIWVDGARPANTWIPLSFLGNMAAWWQGISTSMISLQVLKNYQTLVKSLFIIKNKNKNQRKSLTNSLLARASLSKPKFDIFTGPINSVSTILIIG
jgi:hypothetical protein